jgi:hypothetical protein
MSWSQFDPGKVMTPNFIANLRLRICAKLRPFFGIEP